MKAVQLRFLSVASALASALEPHVLAGFWCISWQSRSRVAGLRIQRTYSFGSPSSAVCGGRARCSKPRRHASPPDLIAIYLPSGFDCTTLAISWPLQIDACRRRFAGKCSPSVAVSVFVRSPLGSSPEHLSTSSVLLRELRWPRGSSCVRVFACSPSCLGARPGGILTQMNRQHGSVQATLKRCTGHLDCVWTVKSSTVAMWCDVGTGAPNASTVARENVLRRMY